MELTKQLAELTREQLHERVWSVPVSKLSEEFGLSDVAIAKRCKKLNVPCPPRGYWAKVQAGRKPRKTPLPPTKEEAFASMAGKEPVRRRLPRSNGAPLFPLAADFLSALRKCKNSYDKRIHLKEPTLPEATISQALVERCAKAFHVILQGTDPVGIPFKKSLSSYEGGIFRVGRDRLYFEIEEEMVHRSATASPRGRRPLYSAYDDGRVPCGFLTFKLKDSRYGSRFDKSWNEGGDLQLEDLLVQLVGAIRGYFVDVQKKRAQDAIDQERRNLEWEERQREQDKVQAMREEAKRRKKHAKAVRKIVRRRRNDLLKAAEWWRLHRVVLDFAAACEEQWMTAQSGRLDPDQASWLKWARETALEIAPSSFGYPDPSADGPFILSSVPFGGPYPKGPEFSRPPTMPKMPKMIAVKQQGYGDPEVSYQPYPFWLKHQGR